MVGGKQIAALLVEDHPLVRKMAIITLEQLNCKVDAVETGKLAIEYANKKSYDIIFMDIGLPDLDGLSVISHIRAMRGTNFDVPIIALTAHSDREYIKQSFEMGATDFFVKPLNNDMGRQVLQRYTD
jgi:DNA-binding response OmpR family regulator